MTELFVPRYRPRLHTIVKWCIRCVSTTEKCCRIFTNELHANMPHVLKLALHSNDLQPVYFSGKNDIEGREINNTLTVLAIYHWAARLWCLEATFVKSYRLSNGRAEVRLYQRVWIDHLTGVVLRLWNWQSICASRNCLLRTFSRRVNSLTSYCGQLESNDSHRLQVCDSCRW